MSTPRSVFAPMDRWRTAFTAWWARHTQRERWLMTLCVVLALLALLWMMLLQPAWQALDTARTQLPQLRSDRARIQAIVHEAVGLQQGRGAKVHASQVWMILPGSLQRANLSETVTMTSHPQTLENPRWEFVLHNAPTAPLLDWLAGLPRLNVRVQTLTLERAVVDGREQPGLLNGNIVLMQDAP